MRPSGRQSLEKYFRIRYTVGMSKTTRRLSYKMYPDAAQAAALDAKARHLRDLWNAALQERIDAYRL